jgi:hypothetical protein
MRERQERSTRLEVYAVYENRKREREKLEREMQIVQR